MAYEAVVSLSLRIESLLNLPYSNIFLPITEIESIHHELWSLKAILKLDHFEESERVNSLKGQTMEAITKLRDVLESHVNKYQSLSEPRNELIFSQDLEIVKQEMVSFKQTIRKIEVEYSAAEDPVPRNVSLLAADSVTSEKYFDGKVNMVGRLDDINKLNSKLLEGTRGLKKIAVVGMGGIGKTTLVKYVYNEKLISFHFDVRAFVRVGPQYNLRNIFLDLLHQFGNTYKKEVQEESDHQLRLDMYHILEGRRYLIVFDDVWDIPFWDVIARYFPDHQSGSRIIFTTRLSDLADYFSSGTVHVIPFLNKEESWKLFCREVFDGVESCPYPSLEKVGKKIVQLCGGLPLGIISIADLLSKAKKTLDYWEKVAKNDNIFEDTPVSKVLFLSYKYLPPYLKECFLYMGVFPLNHEISISKLIKLWIAEGLIKPNSLKTFEYTAKEYLEDLVSRNVVLIRQQSSSDRIKTCNAHYFFWHLCVREAAKKKISHLINKYPDSFSESMRYQRRLCIHRNVLLGIKDVSESIKSASNVSSFLCTGPDHRYPVTICSGSTALKVLDALTIRFYEFPIEILELVQLRYLSFTFNGKLPPSISKLQNLLSLIVHQYHLNIINYSSGCGDGAPSSYMPMEIWDMRELRHLQVMGSDLPDPVAGAFLPNLLTLLGVCASSCRKEVFERIPNLEKLGVQIALKHGASGTLRVFDHLALLSKLKSFKCVVSNPDPRAHALLWAGSISSVNFPSSLTKLTLSGCGFVWKDDMSFIAALPNLKVLKLRCYAFQGPEWEPDEDEFPKLEYLLLEDTDLVHWRPKENCFPELQRLTIRHCYKLEEISSELGDSSCLQVIEVVDSPLALASVEKIQEEQMDNGNDMLEFQICSSWHDK